MPLEWGDEPWPERKPSNEPGWIIEEGIGETRALLLDQYGEVVASKLYWHGELVPGSVIEAKMVSQLSGARRGTFRTEDGQDILVDHFPPEACEGGTYPIRIHRAPIAERGRLKLGQGRILEADRHAKAQPQIPIPEGKRVRSFPNGLWEEVWLAASSGDMFIFDGSLLFDVTPAMTLIDVDGAGGGWALGMSVATDIAKGLRWFDIGGNIGIDFPTIQDKSQRKDVDAELERCLADWPHERTAMNGFGFVQIVARLEGPSLLHRFATSRVGMCARYALRVAERAEGTGPVVLLTVHPALKAKLKPEWLEELARRSGRQVRIETNPALALEAPQAQILSQ